MLASDVEASVGLDSTRTLGLAAPRLIKAEAVIRLLRATSCQNFKVSTLLAAWF
jgi:hypothetical protein